MKKLNKQTENDALYFPRISRQYGLSITFLIIVFLVTAITWSSATLAEPVASDIESPVAMLERKTTQVIKILRDERELLQREPERVHRIVDDYILPSLDDVTMAKLAMGKHWRTATREQKRAFVKEFRNLLIRTYSKSLLEFKDQGIRYFPLIVPADANRTTVKAEVVQPGGPSIPLAYRMRIKDNVWKVYDIKIDGISLVTSYRGTFTQEIRKGGIDGLLSFLRKKNS